MTCRQCLLMALLTAVMVGQPLTALSQPYEGDAGPPAPPTPPLSGTSALRQSTAIHSDAPATNRQPATDVPSIRFKGSGEPAEHSLLNVDVPSKQPRRAEAAGKSPLASANSPIPSTAITVAQDSAVDQTQFEQSQVDPLVELTARLVEDDAVVAADNEEFIPADMQACDDCCCPPCRPLMWVAGVEATFLWPDANNHGADFEFEDGQQQHDVAFSSATDGVDSMILTPRVWLGVQGCQWGANVRYWHLRGCDSGFDPVLDESNGWTYADFDWDAEPDTGYFSNSELDAYTIDLEATRRFCVHDCAMQASFGVRYGSVKLHDSITAAAVGDDTRFMSYGRADSYSRGTGVVMGLYGRKPLFPCSCVHWFYNARWSALWGPTCTSAETFAAVMVDGSNAGSINSASTYVDDTLFIGEIQLGLEWTYALRCLPANAFFRTAIEYQRWDGGPGFSEAGSFASYTGSGNTSTADTETSAASPQLDLVGLTLGTGLTW